MKEVKSLSSREPEALNFEPIPEARQELHRFFRFSGSFHPPLVHWLIKNQTKGKLIGDPLAGSGSVAVEGISKGCNVLSMDIDPLSCLITFVKSNPINPDLLGELVEKWLALTKTTLSKKVTQKTSLTYLEELETRTKYSSPENVFHWFDAYIVAALSKALLALQSLSCPRECRRVLEAIVAATLRRVSRADTQPVSGLEVTKIMKERLARGLTFDLIDQLRKRSKILISGYKELLSYKTIGRSTVIPGDTLTDWKEYCSENDLELDLIITSPPYCNAIEYWRRHKLEYLWLGLMDEKEIMELSRKFIGSTTVRKKDLETLKDTPSHRANNAINNLISKGEKTKAMIVRKYVWDSQNWVNNVLPTLRSSGTAYIVVGPSKSYGVEIDTPGILAEIIDSSGYVAREKIRYSIKNRRMQYPTRNHSIIKTETILEVNK